MVRKLFCLVLALLLYLPAGLPAAQDTGKNTAGKTKNDLARVQDRIRKLETQNRKDVARRGELDRQLRDAETEAARVRKELNATRRALAEANRQLAELTERLEATRTELEKQRDELAGQLRLAHITGGSEQVRAIFNQQDPAELGRRLTWLGFLARSRSELLGSIQLGLEALERDRQAVEEQQNELATLESQRREQLAKLDSARKERSTIIASLDSQVKGQKQQLSRARDEAAGLQRVLRELERAAANARRQAATQGKATAWPPPGGFRAATRGGPAPLGGRIDRGNRGQ